MSIMKSIKRFLLTLSHVSDQQAINSLTPNVMHKIIFYCHLPLILAMTLIIKEDLDI